MVCLRPLVLLTCFLGLAAAGCRANSKARDAGAGGTLGTGGAVSQAVADYVPMAVAPVLMGASQWQQWAHGAPVVGRDNHGNHELFTFGSPGAPSGKLHLLRSADRGTSWSWVSPDAYAQPVDSDTNGGLMSVAQDSAGTVHLLYFRSGYLQVAYYRLSLTYAAGAITGYTGLVGPITVPGTYGGDKRGLLRTVTTASGAEVLAVLVTASDTGSTAHLQGSLCITSSLAPMTAADFKSLDGAPGAVSRVIDDARGLGGSHDHTILFAQLGATRDLWLFAGNIPAEPVPTASSTLSRLRLTASGSTWTAAGPLTDGATANAWLMGVAGTAHYVWAMFGRYADGQVLFARVGADGAYEEPLAAIPSPVNDGRIEQTQFGTFTVHPDEAQIWAIFTRDPAPQGRWFDFTPTAAYWNGGAWQLRSDVPQGDSGAIAFAEGFAGTVGWDNGVVGLMTRTDNTAFNGPIHVATLRGLDGGSP